MPAAVDVIGRRFGRWTVVTNAAPKNGRRRVVCRCDCGQVCDVEPRALLRGRSASCGCLHRDVVRDMCADRITHGMKGSGEYESWQKMKGRCHNPNDKKFAQYGARGIAVCDEWRASFETFLRDMGPRPTPTHTIDRIDNERGYSPENCRWATKTEQARNRRCLRFVSVDGQTMPLSAACEMTGANYRSALYRISRGRCAGDGRIHPLHAHPERTVR